MHENPLLLGVGSDVAAVPGTGIEVSGTVVDSLGKPVAGASVTVTVETGTTPGDQPGSTLVTHERSALTTDANGRYDMTFSSEKGRRFRAIATPPNHTVAGTAWLTADGGQTIRFDPIRVTPLKSITGRVVEVSLPRRGPPARRLAACDQDPPR
jgi:hypothetical protein